ELRDAFTRDQNSSWLSTLLARICFREASRIEARCGECAISRRSTSSSLSTPTMTATALPFRVTTIGPRSLALIYELNCALTVATEAIFIALPLRRPQIIYC